MNTNQLWETEDVTFMIGLDVLSYCTDSESAEAVQIIVLLVIVQNIYERFMIM